MTAVNVLPPGAFVVASGASLHRCDLANGKFQKMELPPGLRHTITAIAIDDETMWLGTDGDGVAQLSISGQWRRQFQAADGLLSSQVKALARLGGRLWIGFGAGESGGLGYLETDSGKFVAVTPPAAMAARRENAEGPPASAVHAIKTSDEKTLWVASSTSLKRYNIESAKWSMALPFGPRHLSVASTFATVSSPRGGVLVCQLPGNHWTHVPLSGDAKDNVVHALRVEGRRIWVGTVGAVRWIDVSDGEVIGGCAFTGGAARWICPNPDYIWFVADTADGSGSELLRFFKRPSHVMQARGP
jgi:ligand-binding sensor domain-containing protein